MSYSTALLIEKREGQKLWALRIGILLTLIPLLLFKYYNFFNDAICDVLQSMSISYEHRGLNWAIPVGLSFYTLQAISYMSDVYLEKIKAEKVFMVYALYLSFFPTILMGPINRASQLIPQIKNIRPYFDYSKSVEGLKLMLWGMFMKVVVADRTGLYVDSIYNYLIYSGSTCFMASIMYTVQIYCDFAGYSLMAMGVGKTMGFEVTNNFRRPFFAHSVSDYWTRWHLSLSSWLRDYIYIPLGGSRAGRLKTYRNIFLTFLVSGLWHGAYWTYILWGLWHALCVMSERFLNQQKCYYGLYGRIVKIVIAFMLVNFSRILFHSPTLLSASEVYGRIFTLEGGVFAPPSLFVIGAAMLVFVKDMRDEFFPERFCLLDNRRMAVRWCTYVLLVTIIMLEGVLDSGQFIYANF